MPQPDSDFKTQDDDHNDSQNQSVQLSQSDEQLEQSAQSTPRKLDYPKWVDTFQGWLANTKSNEVRNLVDFFDRSGEWWATAKELTGDEFQTKSIYLKRDLMMFYRHYQQDVAESEFFQAVKESAWKELADLTDKAQIEWQELEQDFRHQGTYEQGEWVGMGTIVCKSCHYKMTFVHPVELTACPECRGSSFLREALAP